jgi:hypothetical protein
MGKEIYTDRQGAIKELLKDKNYNLIAEVWKNDRLIAGLFCCLEVET